MFRSLRLLVALIAWLFATPCLAADAEPATSSEVLDAQNANLVEALPADLAAHYAKWERRESNWKRLGWVGAGFSLASDLFLVGAYFTGAPMFWALGVPLFVLGTSMILPGALIPAYGLQELGAPGRGPALGYVAVALASMATMSTFIAFVFYANDFGYSLSDGTVVFTSAAMLLGFAAHGFAIRQMVVDTKVRKMLPVAAAPRPRLRVAVAPRFDRGPGVAFVGTF